MTFASASYDTSYALAANLPEQFGHLTKLNINHPLRQYGFGDITIYFDARVSTVIDTVYDHPEKNAGFGTNRRLIKTRIDRNTETTYTIDFSPGMSVDPNFIIFRNIGNELKELTRWGIGGTQLIVPGDGFLYISGHTNNTFNQHRIFRVDVDEIIEVEQSFYYVGLQSVTNKEILIWNENSVITILPKGTPIHVLLMKNESYPNFSYLVKTETGLVGWVRFKPEELNMWNKPNPIEGLYYKGD
jgi:hypothetical protein